MIIQPMQTLTRHTGTNPWPIRLLTFLLAALAAASAVYWVMMWPNRAEPPRGDVNSPPPMVIDSNKVAQLLGASQPASGAASVSAAPTTNFKLLGVVAQGQAGAQGQQGSALISVDNAPAKPFRVGDVVSEGLVLQSVQARSANLAASMTGPASVTLALPELAKP